ncbi:MAG: 50S ribosomal protein L21 [Patescibacteria group bacterium]
MTFAVIETGGKQYQVSAGETISIEKLDVSEGEAVVFDHVLLIDDGVSTKTGEPYISGSTVKGTATKQGRGKKVMVVKYKAKVRYQKKNGHRQPFTEVKIESIA